MPPSPHPLHQLRALDEANLRRHLKSRKRIPGKVSGNLPALWDFASNDYLAFSKHPEISAAYIEGIQEYGAGAGASRLITGSSPAHFDLENQLASLKQAEAALTFPSGYTAALSCLPVICSKGDYIVMDRLAHASLIDAARLSQATLRIFPHNNTQKLTEILNRLRSKNANAKILVVTESVFSMDGDLCPLAAILDACESFGAELFLDEAHATGILGENGMGLAEKLGLHHRIAFQMGTFSKALGLSGAFLACSRPWVDLFINRARGFIYTTATPPASAHAASAALRLCTSTTGRKLRKQLWDNINILKPGHTSAIIPVLCGESQLAIENSLHLENKGYLVPAIRFPTVARSSARLRITVSAAHSHQTINALRRELSLLDLPDFPAPAAS